MNFTYGLNDAVGNLSGFSNVVVYNANGKVKFAGGSGSAAWGSIGSGSGVGSQTDLVTYLNSNYYPLLSNPSGYLTAASAALTYVPLTRTITINGVTQDLSADRTFTIAAGVSSVTATSPITSSGGATPDISTSMLTNRLIGRGTAGTGVMEEISLGTGLSLSGTTLNVSNIDLSVLSVSTANQREDNWAPTGWPGTDIVKVISITPTNTDKVLIISGLSNPAAGRVVTLRNSGTNQLIILEQRGAGSLAANRFNFTGNGSYFLLPERSVTLLYDGTFWNQLSSTGIYGGFDSFDDFTSITPNYATTSSNMYHFLLSGTGSGVRSDGISGFYGTIAISTGTTTTGNVRGSVDFRRGGGFLGGTTSRPAVVLNKVFTPVLPAVGNDYYFQCGLNGSTPTATAGTAGFGFNWQVPTIASGVTNWQTINSNTIGTIVNTTTSGLALTTSSFVWLGIFLTGVHGEAVYFYSTNGSDYVVDNRFLRTSGNYLATPYISVVKTTGTTARDVQVDFSGVSFNNTVR